MPDVETFKITSKEGTELLGKIEKELAHTSQRQADSNGNREYEPIHILHGDHGPSTGAGLHLRC